MNKIIHQIWIQGQDNIPDKFKKNIDKIININPGWKYYLWDEIKIIELIKNTNIKWLDKYYKFQYLHQKIDMAKLVILYNYGGIYIDIDAYTIKSLDELFDQYQNYDFVISKLQDMGPLDNYITCRYSNSCINNGVFFGKAKTDILKYLIDNITYDCHMLDNKMTCISKTTGPVYFNKLIRNYKNKSKIKILDSEYLEPCTKKLCNITKNTYIVHKHENTWIYSIFAKFIDIYLNHKYLVIIILALILFYCFFI